MCDTDAARGGLSVLVVEDDADAAATYAAILGLSGHRPRVARDGGEALRHASEEAPDVVLLDIGLPGMDGFEVARQLRRMPEGQGALLVAVTGYGEDANRAMSLEAGFDIHTVKPLHLERLRSLLDVD